jgi:hypothetical protein
MSVETYLPGAAKVSDNRYLFPLELQLHVVADSCPSNAIGMHVGCFLERWGVFYFNLWINLAC